MLSHWLIVVPKVRRAGADVPRRIEAVLSRFLYYLPEHVFLNRYANDIWCLSLSVGTQVWGMERPYERTDRSFVALAGVPTLESAPSVGSLPRRVQSVLYERGPQWVYENVGGTFSIGALRLNRVGHATVSAFSDFSGYNSCFYIDTESFFAVGNRASLVGAFRSGFPERHEIDADALSFLVGNTMILGTETAFAGVSRLRSGYCISASKNIFGRVSHPTQELMDPDHFAPVPGASMDHLPVDEICDRLGRRVRWCVERGVNFRAHLTGGRDTRAIGAVLSGQDLLHSVGSFLTTGTEENGDVIVARRVAAALGIDKKHRIVAGAKGNRALSTEELAAALCRSPFIFECQLTAYDGRKTVLGKIPMDVTLMGGGGEIYRQEWGSSALLEGCDGASRALRLFSRHDRLALLTDRAKERQLEAVAGELRHLQERGAINLACAFYLEERLSNWGCGHFSNGPSTQFPLLLDQQLARYILSIGDVSEHVHFELIRHGDKRLLEIPFLNNRWAGATDLLARELGLAPDPIVVPAKRNFPWQFDCYMRFRDAIIDFCLECGGAMLDVVPAENLERLRQQPVEPFGSAHIKTLFGLCGAIIFAEEGWSRARDFDNGSRPLVAGNRKAVIRAGLRTTVAARSDVANALVSHLRAADVS